MHGAALQICTKYAGPLCLVRLIRRGELLFYTEWIEALFKHEEEEDLF